MAPTDISLVGGHSANVVGMLSDEVGVEIIQGLTHLACMILVDTENDRFCEAVGSLQEVREVRCDSLGAGAQGYDSLELLGVVLTIRDRSTVAVDLALGGAPPRCIPRSDYTVHSVGSEEPVVDSLAQAVCVDRVPEVAIGISVVVS